MYRVINDVPLVHLPNFLATLKEVLAYKGGRGSSKKKNGGARSQFP